MVGVISQISAILAKHSIPLFVVSTYDTDWILVEAVYREKVIQVLRDEGNH